MRLILAILIFLAASCAAYADDDPPEYRLQVGDEVRFLVWNEEALNATTEVLSDGTMTFPLVGRLTVLNMTLAEVEAECRDKLSRYLVDPVVNIVVISPHVPRFKIFGKVVGPGKYILQPGDTLIDAVAYAGGFGRRCDVKHILILNKGSAKLVNLKSYLLGEGGPPEEDLLIYDGDLIIVPEVGRPDWSLAMPYITAAVQSVVMSADTIF